MFFLIENNQITEGPLNQLPRTYVKDDITHPLRELWSKGHVADVNALGWQEAEVTTPSYDPTTHKLGEITYSVADDIVSGEYTVEPLSTEELRSNLQAARDAALNEMTHTFSDNTVIQVRPSDLTNFNIAIQVGIDRDWIMANNTVRMTTVAEMQEAMNSGIAQAQAIWDQYAQELKAL
jgi:hypothetical protein